MSDASAEDIYHALVQRMDVRLLSRAEWRGACHGLERARMQRLLIELAEQARQGPRSERIALLKGAHAVLPLRGEELVTLASLLADAATISIEWADVFVEALSSNIPGLQAEAPRILSALQQVVESAPDFPDTDRRIASIVFFLNAHGYTPEWVKARTVGATPTTAAPSEPLDN